MKGDEVEGGVLRVMRWRVEGGELRVMSEG